MEEEKFKHTELTFQLMVDSSPNAIVLVNKEGKIAYVNHQTEILFGYKRFDLIGQKVEQLLPNRYRKNHPEFREIFFLNPTVRNMGVGRELFALRKDGKEFPVEIGLNPIVTVDGTLVLASIIDITERKKAEERFKLVVDSAPNAMILVNDKGEITLVNNEVKTLFGYQEKELVGQHLHILIPSRFQSKHKSFIELFFMHPQKRSMGVGRELFALRKDGTEIPVEIGLNPIETTDGLMVLASIIDITERKKQEASYKKQVELESKNKELENFAYLASHDLQEPLRTLSNYIQILKEENIDQLNTIGKKSLNRMLVAINRMNGLISVLLDFSRLGRNRTLAYKNCKDIIEEAIADLTSLITKNDAEVIIEDEMPTLNVYEIEMRQLFENLVNNSIKFKQKGKKPMIKIKAKDLTDRWMFSIIDNGIGIEEKNYDRIFQIFQRLHKRTQYSGYGIGLSNCKRIVELHKGEIWIESEVGKGSTFNFTIANQL